MGRLPPLGRCGGAVGGRRGAHPRPCTLDAQPESHARRRLQHRRLVGHPAAALEEPRPRPRMWKNIRIALLLFVLLGVAVHSWLDRIATQSWKETLWVGIFPLNADGTPMAQRYVEGLTAQDLDRKSTRLNSSH